MDGEAIFDDTVPQRAVMVTRTTRYLVPVAAKTPLDDIAALDLRGDDLAKYDRYTDTITIAEAPLDDVVLHSDELFFPGRALRDAVSHLLPPGDGHLRHRIGDAAEEIRRRRAEGPAA